MTKTISEAVLFCGVRTTFIDLPTRLVVAKLMGFPLIHVGVSFVAHFVPCFVSSLITYCDNEEFLCKAVQGGVLYAARAKTIGNDVIGRSFVGVANKWVYNSSASIPVFVETLEAMSVALIKKAAGYTDVIVHESTALGLLIGTMQTLLDMGLAQPMLAHIKSSSQIGVVDSDTNITVNDSSVTALGAVDHDEV